MMNMMPDTHSIHGTGEFTYMFHKFQPHVQVNRPSYMDLIRFLISLRIEAQDSNMS